MAPWKTHFDIGTRVSGQDSSFRTEHRWTLRFLDWKNISTFSANSHDLVASPDGKHFCFGDRGLDVQPSPLGIGHCTAISPDGTRTYRGGVALIEEGGAAESNNGFGKGIVALPPATGGMVITPDGATLYVAESDADLLYAYDAKTNLLYDVVHVCKHPLMLGIQPITTATK